MKCTLIILVSFLVSMSFAQTPGSLKWTFDANKEIAGCAAIATDGTIYVGSKDNNLYAINIDGTKKWEFEAAGTISAAPAIGSDGTIYFGSFMSKFYALNSNGTLKWDYTTGILNDNSPAIGHDGTIYNASSDGLYAFKPDGTLKWKYDLFNSYSTPAIAKDGTIYFGVSTDFYAFKPDGTKKWSIRIGEIESSPAIGTDGIIYVGSKDKNLYALNQDGSVKWKFKTGGLIIASPVIDANGVIYIGSYDKKFYAVNPDGTEKWSFLSGSEFYRTSAAAVGSNGVVYVGASEVDAFWNQKLVALNQDGSVKWEHKTDVTLYSAVTIGDDGTVYVGGYGGILLAVNGESDGLANSAWPRIRNNNKGTGLLSLTTEIKQSNYKHANILNQNFPNPFSNQTNISFTLPESDYVSLIVYDVNGREIAELINGKMTAGEHSFVFDVLEFKRKNTSGIYFCKLRTSKLVDVKRMMTR